jgi:hypothetical protein
VIEFALGANGAAVGQHDMFGDRQSQPGSSRFARARLVHPVETLEQAGQVLGGNAGTEILHIEFDAFRDRPCPQNDPSS